MKNLEARLDSTTEEPRAAQLAEIERYNRLLMNMLDDAEKELEKWPSWMRQYTVTTNPY